MTNSPTNSPRVRFAPSPTGFLHVGSARTFIFNWLYARHNNGTMILRVDDTDVERNTDASLTSIFEGLQWLNLNWDEQYKQSERLNLHREMAAAILKKGLAYRDFTPAHAGEGDRSTQTKIDPKDLRVDTYRPSGDGDAFTAVRITHIPTGTVVTSNDEKTQSKNREKAMRLLSSKLSERVLSTWLFNPGMRDLPQKESDALAAAGEPFALRFRVPREAHREIRFTDAVYGDQSKSTADIEDFALLRSDGMPTYHLASCADDADMRITHVIRGQDHLSNTFKHILIFDAAGSPLPQFAHLPLLVAPDGTKLSKRRHGPVVSVTTYRDAGFLPEAFINFLCLLGWSPKNDREQMTREELVESFSLEAINRSNAVVNFKENENVGRAPSPAAFDSQAVDLPNAANVYPEETFDPKALWLNAEHIRSLPIDDLTQRLLPIVQSAGYRIDLQKLQRITPLIRERIKLLRDVLTAADFLFVDELPPYNPAELIPQKGDVTLALKVLKRARDLLAQNDFTHDALDSTLRAAAQDLGIKPGQMFQPIRVAVCGRKNAPPLFETLEVLGRETTLGRIDKAILKLQQSEGQ